ncbi:hypothetical protein BV22DRAFT_1051001 [Leucogyrophana mollusca]|uniref:Uncharacterized protein n=1 Tax=Leucogyrophana mollusca TaxID=85980 RepID=A0ACB8B2M3_9AGAM|nr:hypothetical protein BV22DRAFT_1051001 [Leucogyrophana mollusca]
MTPSVVARADASPVSAHASTVDVSSQIDQITALLGGIVLSREAADALVAPITLAANPREEEASIASPSSSFSDISSIPATSAPPSVASVTSMGVTVTTGTSLAVLAPTPTSAPPAVAYSPSVGTTVTTSPAVPPFLLPPRPPPVGHEIEYYQGSAYCVPVNPGHATLYCITKGRRVGIIASWHSASPLVSSVRRALFDKCSTLAEGKAAIQVAIESQELELL